MWCKGRERAEPVGSVGPPVCFGVDVLHGDLEAIEASGLWQLHLRREALAEVFVDDTVRGSEEGEDVRDEVLLVLRQLLPVRHVMLRQVEQWQPA